MPQGFFLGIGLNRLDPRHYGSDGLLRNPENDAEAMRRIAAKRGLANRILLSDEATAAEVQREFEYIAARAQTGDLVVIAYSGHGSQIPDESGLEADGLDETFCLFDRMMPGAEFHRLLALLPDCRTVVFSDACHSGSFVRGLWTPDFDPPAVRRSLLRSQAQAIYEQNRALYDGLRAAPPAVLRAAVLSLSACGDGQLASDGARDNGAFTEALLKAWGGGWSDGNYQQFLLSINDELDSPTQTPEYHAVSWADPNFETQAPFTV